jgi:hypothetical protein
MADTSSIINHYKVLRAEAIVNDIQQYVADATEEIQSLRARLRATTAELEESEQNLILAKVELEETVEIRKACSSELEANSTGTVVFDQRTGTLPGEVVNAKPKHLEFVSAVNKVRTLMAEGNVDEARRLELQISCRRSSFDPRLLGVNPSGPDDNVCIVGLAHHPYNFPEPRSNPSNEDLDTTLKYARKNHLQFGQDGEDSDFLMKLIGGVHGNRMDDFPAGVNRAILFEISLQRDTLKLEHERQEMERLEAEEEMERLEAEEDEIDEDESRSMAPFEMDLAMDECAFTAIEADIITRLEERRRSYKDHLNLPTATSAPIARYNTGAHFAFKSNEANGSLGVLDDALVRCQLRRQPTSGRESSGNKARFPFIDKTVDMLGFDVDGDLIASCGDLYHEHLMGGAAYVGSQTVPCTVNLQSAKGCCDLRDKNGIDIPGDVEIVYKGREVGHRAETWFTECIADAQNDRIWACSSRTGTIHAFSSAEGLKRAQRPVALLSFEQKEKETNRKYMNATFGIARCGDVIVGSAGTSRLSLWNMQQAVEEYNERGVAQIVNRGDNSDESDSDSDTDPREEDQNNKKRQKRQKSEPYNGFLPQMLQVEDESVGFRTGDIEWIGGKQLLIAEERNKKPRFSSIRLFDIEREKVMGLFCGLQKSMSIEKQYCVDRHKCIFTADEQARYVWDTRTYCPVFTLLTKHYCGRVVGVPGSSNMVAFAFEDKSECIQCWDLRMPASHAYTMATGNTNVRHLRWHEGTSSLLASTSTIHSVRYGQSGRQYMYGEEFDPEENQGWPSRAIHEPTYFGIEHGREFHIDEPAIIQYAFENGREMGA